MSIYGDIVMANVCCLEMRTKSMTQNKYTKGREILNGAIG